jgi:hypothetical protein
MIALTVPVTVIVGLGSGKLEISTDPVTGSGLGEIRMTGTGVGIVTEPVTVMVGEGLGKFVTLTFCVAGKLLTETVGVFVTAT